jgi:hypothetical protein
MPKVTRNSAAARPTRKPRPVFGDVSNKGKNDGKTKKAGATAIKEEASSVVSTAGRQRGSHLSRGSIPDDSSCPTEEVSNNKGGKAEKSGASAALEMEKPASAAAFKAEEAQGIVSTNGRQRSPCLSSGHLRDMSKNEGEAMLSAGSKTRKSLSSAILEVEEVEEPATSALLEVEEVLCSGPAADRRPSSCLSRREPLDEATKATSGNVGTNNEAASAVLEVEEAPTSTAARRQDNSGLSRDALPDGTTKAEAAPSTAATAKRLAEYKNGNDKDKVEEAMKPASRSISTGKQIQSSVVADEHQTAATREASDEKKPAAIQRRHSTRTTKGVQQKDSEGSSMQLERSNCIGKAKAPTEADQSAHESKAAPDYTNKKHQNITIEDKTEQPERAPPARQTRASSRSKPVKPVPAPTKSTRHRNKNVNNGEDSAAEADNNASRRRARSPRAAASNAKTELSVTDDSARTDDNNNDGSLKRLRDEDEARKSRKSARRNQASSPLTDPPAPTPCYDFVQQDDFRLTRGDPPHLRFDASKFTRGIAPVDQANIGKIEEAPEYVTDIMQRLFAREVTKYILQR